MKILKISYEWPPPWEGLVPHPYELTKAQVKFGNTFNVFAGRWSLTGPQPEDEGIKIIPFMGSSAIPFRELYPGTLLVTIAPILLLRYVFWRRKKSNEVDLIHCHGHFSLWVYWYRKFLSKYFPKSKELRTPLVVHFHNTVEGRWQKMLEAGQELKPLTVRLDWPLGKKSDMLAIEVADALIFVSEEVKNEAIKYYNADPKRCFVIESGVNPELFKPMGSIEKEKVHKDLGLEPFDKLILNLGAQVRRKNIHLLVQSLLHLPEKYKLLLVGTYPDEDYKSEIDQFIAKNGLEGRVLFGGYQPYPEVPIVYQGADIFVLPSSFEGTPKVVMESIACAVPVLGSAFKLKYDIPGIYYLNDLEPKTIAKQIYDIVEPTVFVDRNLLVSYYSWESRAKEVEEVYKTAFTNRAKTLEKLVGYE